MKKSNLNQRRKPKQARAIAKYDAVLDACTQVLLEKGYRKATMFELSLESGVAVPTIYQYFDNKEEVFRIWFSRLGEKVFQELLDQVVASQAEDIVNAYLKAALESVSKQRQSARILLEEFPQALSTELVTGLEQQALTFVGSLLLFDEKQLQSERLLLLVRLMLGYMLQTVLFLDRDIDIELESQELSRLVYFHFSRAV